MAEFQDSTEPMENTENSTNGLTNGLSNGTGTSEHKESSKDKSRSDDRHKSSHRDKDRHSSSHKSSHKDKHKDRHSSSHKDRHSSSHKDGHRSDKSRDDKDKHRSDDKDKHRSSDKHKDGKDRSKSDKDRSKSDKDRSKSDKDRSKSDSHRDRSKSDKDRPKDDKERSKEKSDKDKHRSSDKSSSDKHKSSSHKSSHHHSSSHKSSHKERHRDKSRDEKVKTEIIKTEPTEMEYENADFNEEYVPAPVATEVPEMKSEYMDSEEETKLVIKEESMKEEEEEEDEDEYVPPFVGEKIEEEEEDFDDDDVPLAVKKRQKMESEDDEDDVPLVARKKVKKERKRKKTSDDEDDDDFKPSKKRKKQVKPVGRKGSKSIAYAPPPSKSPKTKNQSPSKAAKKRQEEEQNVWKWWEEDKKTDGLKWVFLEHRGPVFADPYELLPKNVKFFYKGEHFHLSEDAEETAGFYARMLDHDYTTKEVFNRNFFKDWRKQMTSKERELIIDLSKCNFKQLQVFYLKQSEDRKNRTKDEKKALREKNEAAVEEYGWCNIDGHKQKIGNFRIEPPGLFRGRGEHPKQGMLKGRTFPEDVRINCSKDSAIPQPPAGRKWKEVRHDNSVSWLACWNENIQGQTKYVMLNAASKLKGEKDWQKYESARRLHKHINRIRTSYQADWKNKEMKTRQRGVALYFIDILALRAGNEKDEDQADTVGCCSLRVEHIQLHEEKDGKQYVVVFDFLGKDSIRYYNEITVEKRVFKNLQLFVENKQTGDDLFDRLNTSILNKYLNELLDGLTAKVFRTYNASRTLQEQLERMTDPSDNIPTQVLTYNRANREVAILCNHQRAIPKTFEKSMANLQQKIDEKKDTMNQYEKDIKDLKRAAKHGSMREKDLFEKKKKALEKLKDQLNKLEISATDKDENKQIALGTSKLNYLDPRISVAWCKKYDIPIEKVYNKTQRQKFQWAIDMATADYKFTGTPMKMNNTKEESEDEY